MDEKFIKEILAKTPGAKRASRGVLIPMGDEGYFHITNVIGKEETEGLTNDETFYSSFCSKSEILRLRELKSAHDYLLRIRAEAIVDSPRAVRVFLERKERYEKTGRKWSLTHYYHSKDAYHKQYIKNLPKALAKQLRGTPTGMAYINEANATCVRTLLGDIVFVSEGLEYFFYFMNIGVYGEKYGISVDDRFHALLIAIRIMLGAEALDFDIDSRGALPANIDRQIRNDVTNQMQFTYGHEFAHKLNGHMSSPEDNDQLVFSHDLEFEADIAAIDIFNRKDHATYGKIRDGAITTLVFLAFLENSLNLMTTTKLSISSTHPSSIERLHSLCGSLGKESPLNSAQIDELNDGLIENAEIIKTRLGDRLEQSLSNYGSVYLPSYKKRILEDRVEI